MSTGDSYLVIFATTTLAILTGGAMFRRAARSVARPGTANGSNGHQGLRRRSGALLALGPLIGSVLVPSETTELIVLVLTAAGLAVFGALVERRPDATRLTTWAILAAAAVVVAAGARFEPTGVDLFDIVLGFVIIVAVTASFDGMGNADGLASGLGLAMALPLFALAGFSGDDTIAAIALGLTASCFAFLAFNTRPASLFVGRAGRLTIGFTVAALALSIDPRPGHAWQGVVVPTMLVAVPLVDAFLVVVGRARHRLPITGHRPDHLFHRLLALHWSGTESIGFLVFSQTLLGVDALLLGRGVIEPWLGGALAVAIVGVLLIEGARAHIEGGGYVGLRPAVWLGILVLVLALVAASLPTAVAATDARALMDRGRVAATRALEAARDGDTLAAREAFVQAAIAFRDAGDKLGGPTNAGARGVPVLAPNARVAKELAAIGEDLALAGRDVTASIDPEALQVVDGRLPLQEVEDALPALRRASAALTRARARLDAIGDEPYLLSPVRDALRKLHRELTRAERESRNAAAAALVAHTVFGGDRVRTYMILAQNPAEGRATGGLIGNYGIMRAIDGKITVDPFAETNFWNFAIEDAPKDYEAPADYHARYDVFTPQYALQTVNYSPDFPTVAKVIMNRAPLAGLPKLDGVLAVDPWGLAALLELSGPVRVAGWPTEITATNVVDLVLKDQYAAFSQSTRADFLGSIAQASVERATTGALGQPAKLAEVLGGAAHKGHLVLAFADKHEQRVAEQLKVAGKIPRVRSDAVLVTSSNQAGNKADVYLDRLTDYRIQLRPDDDMRTAVAIAQLTVSLKNNAPTSGLPSIVIGPYESRFVAGQNRQYVTLYSPLDFLRVTSSGAPVGVFAGEELDRNATSFGVNILSGQTASVQADLAGIVPLRNGWYELDLGKQPTATVERVRVAIEVPEGWRVAQAPRMRRMSSRQVAIAMRPDGATTLRVRLERHPAAWDLWGRLESGR